MKLLKTMLFMLAFALSGAVFARVSEPVLTLDEVAATASGKALTVADLKQLVTRAAQGKKWIVVPTQDGKLSASLSWRGNKHTIMVEIACMADRYTVTYKNSINMNYDAGSQPPVIHPYYNRYVGELRDAIRGELLRR